ncbi:cardiolipin synthase [Fodinisporobacter ferrooxydans]|uniref:Cardiolipin synthase n=1 Tax=Fodinisporobacter ferrooxydans TaxID=2901836 RepID=A0ABY4CGJ4_9BACL|nr:cardiolipin synthase [Alicyclobacillaceae bacterium MYW30-H2]
MKKHTFALTLLWFVFWGISILFNHFWNGWHIGIINLSFTILASLISLVIIYENRDPSRTITWLTALSINPIIGFLFYLLFGRSYRKKNIFAQKLEFDKRYFERGQKELASQFYTLSNYKKILKLSHNIGEFPISFHTNTKVLTNGQETFPAILSELKQAAHHIHLEYYIIRDDEIGNVIKDVLIEKAKAGVEIRVLYDWVGCFQLSDTYISDLRKYGVKVEPFLPVTFRLFNNRINFRNHRKIIVIDGKKGFVGGLNIGDEYLGKDKQLGFWRDTHLFLEGECVASLQTIFFQDWMYATKESFDFQRYFPRFPSTQETFGGVQIAAGGPDKEWESIKNLFFSMITSAKESIWLASPYFVPDPDVLSALKIAALSGLDVRILFPAKPDKKIVFYASHSYFEELLKAGVKLYEYQKGFIHSKILIVDNVLSSVGTSNIDMRSFHLNFEVNVFLYETESTQQLVENHKIDELDSKELTFAAFSERSFKDRTFESFARLLSPLL